MLNSIDDNCDGLWDEGFNQTDSDADELSDYAEYHIYGTDYNPSLSVWLNPSSHKPSQLSSIEFKISTAPG